ncbi:MAG: hydroxyacid dehydrogenase [Verrucomicrobiales bacterium]|jgi:phosphoglycerate dehydrogenase-like enzyme|nr:hydroxyacid dehydrogenase [Verrucomicrobiales bacterium]
MRPQIAAFFGDPAWIDRVYGPGEKAALFAACRFVEPVINLANFDQHARQLKDVEVVFSTWGMPCLGDGHLDRMPSLRAVFFAAGSVRYFAKPLLDRDILVISAWRANSIPTAEFAFAQILLSMKGGFRNQREYHGPEAMHLAFRGPGNYDESVALLGLGAIGTRVAKFLGMLHVTVLAYDPYLSIERAADLNVERVSLEEAFARAFVVSNHIPHLPETERLLTRELFASMRPNATFINTARGIIVDEAGMIDVLRDRPDLQALLDVTHPEPPVPNSPLFSLPNVCLTSHIAGAINNEVHRLSQTCVREFKAWQKGLPLEHAVTREIAATMA